MVTAKYADHLPLSRQEAIFARHGLEMPRSTLCDWIGRAATLAKPVYELMVREILAALGLCALVMLYRPREALVGLLYRKLGVVLERADDPAALEAALCALPKRWVLTRERDFKQLPEATRAGLEVVWSDRDRMRKPRVLVARTSAGGTPGAGGSAGAARPAVGGGGRRGEPLSEGVFSLASIATSTDDRRDVHPPGSRFPSRRGRSRCSAGLEQTERSRARGRLRRRTDRRRPPGDGN